MVCKGLMSPQDGRCWIRVRLRLLLEEIHTTVSSQLQAQVLAVRAVCREEGMALGHCGLVKDMGLRTVVGKVNSAEAPLWEGGHPTGLGRLPPMLGVYSGDLSPKLPSPVWMQKTLTGKMP